MKILNQHIAELEKGAKYKVQVIQFPLRVNGVEQWVEVDK